MDEAQGADEVMGARERHHVVLPSYPNFHVRGGMLPLRKRSRLLSRCSASS
jgi:hypothetical protein